MRQRTAVLLVCIPLMTGFLFTGGIGITNVNAADTAEIHPDTTQNHTSIDTQTTPGEVTSATTNNPSPSPNRGAFAGLTAYTTAADVSGGVGAGAVVFRGEEDIIFERSAGDEVNPSSLERTAGDNEGVTLELPVPQDQAVGGYNEENDATGFGVTVQQPRVVTLEVQNNQGEDISGGTLLTDQEDASVLVEYNYEEAENIELIAEDESGLEVTQEIVDIDERDNKNADTATPTGSAPDGEVRFDLDPGALDEGEYTVTVAGVEDLDFGSATQSVTTTISADQPASLTLSEDASVRGSDTKFTIEDSIEREFHPVVIDSSEFRDDITLAQAEDLFRNVGDTVETGVADSNGPGASAISNVEYAYAIVEIADENGTGSVETQFLDDSSITLELYPSDPVTPIESHPSGVVLTTNDVFLTDDQENIEINTASSTDVTRTVSLNEIAPGETVTLTTEITGTSGRFFISSSYDPQLSSATVQSVTVNGESIDPVLASANGKGSVITLADIGAGATVTVTEELTVGEEPNVTHSLTGDVTLGEATTEFEPVSVTVADVDTEPQSVVDEFDEDGNGNIEITELGQAGQAFASGELSITELGQIGAAFAS